MMIGLSTLTLDPFGAQLFEAAQNSSLGDTSRRVSRVATLDGGATVLDGGYTVADRTLAINLTSPSKQLVDDLKYLIETYGKLLAFTPDGAFLTVPERLTETAGAVRITLLVTGIAEVKE